MCTNTNLQHSFRRKNYLFDFRLNGQKKNISR
jgi:hypothetical protein